MVNILEKKGVHSPYGPSAAHRWLNCLGSNNLVERLGDKAKKSGPAAREGTAAHTLFATCLTTNTDAWEHVGTEIVVVEEGVVNKFKVGYEEGLISPDFVQQAVDWVRAKVAQFPGAILLVEQKIASPDDPQAYGTGDIVIMVPGDRLIVPDFKYGIGVVVEPDDEQVRLYGHYAFETFPTFGSLPRELTDDEVHGLHVQGIGPIDELDLIFPNSKTVCELWILQPRITTHPKGWARRHVTDRQELARFWYGEALQAIHAGRKPDAPLTMGDWCRFCPANDACPALHKSVTAINPDLDPVALSDDVLGETLDILEQLVKLKSRMEFEAFKRSMAGKKVKGRKLVRQIGERIWKEGAEQELIAALGEAAYTKPELKSPAQIEKVESDKVSGLVARWAQKPNTGLTLAPDSDRRKAASPDALADFSAAQGSTEQRAA